ncbi:unnamed protein product [Paramecium pentaurelia]|uniref:Uncharacterized protein n=1 Tax=Paramecium pentaurelia TaxID=43138 RepID=A0A8S1YE72_9CILI|nr:unnamed protein product [Paramecium pentaurelia]
MYILKCLDGYEFVNNSCLSICGDVIIAQEEDCDEGNTIEFDGCFNCKYSCPLYCLNCQQGTCLQYQNYEQQLNMKLQMNCGDGLLQKQEQCDDGNDQVADGCKNFQIEENWKQVNVIMLKPQIQQFIIQI